MIPPPIADALSFPQALAGGEREQLESVLFDITSDIKLGQHPWVEDMVPALATVFLAVREGPAGLTPALAESLLRLPNFIRAARRLIYAGADGAAVRNALLQLPALKSEHIEVMAPLPVTAEAAWAIFAAPMREELDRRVVFKRAGIRAKRAAREAGETPVWKRSRSVDEAAWIDDAVKGEGAAELAPRPAQVPAAAAPPAQANESGAAADLRADRTLESTFSSAAAGQAESLPSSPARRETRPWPVSPWVLLALGGLAMAGCTAAGALAAWAWLSVPQAQVLALPAQQIRNAAPLAAAQAASVREPSRAAPASEIEVVEGEHDPAPQEEIDPAETLQEVQHAAELSRAEPLPPARFSRPRLSQALPLEAASAGEPAAQRKLGAHYFLGLDRVRDPVLALAWFELAARRDPESARLRDKIARLLGPEAVHQARRMADAWREGELLEHEPATPAEHGQERTAQDASA